MLYNNYMKTKQYKKSELEQVVEALRLGAIIAFPTDTVFGLGCVYDNENAIQHIKVAKGRDEKKPLPMMCANLSMIERVAELSSEARVLIEHLTPGALTLILNKKPEVADYVTNGFPTIAIRIPDDEFILKMLQQLDKPLLVTSANLSNHPSMKEDYEVLNEREGRIDGIVLGSAHSTIASTIVDMTNQMRIVREGAITQEKIDEVLRDFC